MPPPLPACSNLVGPGTERRGLLFFNSNSAEGLFTVFVSAHMPAHGLDGSFKTTLALCGSDTQCGAEGSAAGQLRRDRSGNAGTTTSLRARPYGGRTTLRATSPPGTEFRAVERVRAKNHGKSVQASSVQPRIKQNARMVSGRERFAACYY